MKRPTTAALNRKLALENAKLRSRVAITEKTIENSLGGLAQGLMAGTGPFGGGPMAPITSFAPSLQNNQYAPITLMWTDLMYMYTTHGLLQTAIDMPVLDALRGGIDITSDGELDADEVGELQEWLEEGDILARIGDAFIWARLFGGGALVINSQADCGEPLGDEVQEGPIELYDACRWELTSERRLPASGQYGYYGKKLDKSRVVTILGKRAPWLRRAQLSDWGMSELERVIEDFNMFLRTRNVIYEILDEAKVDIYRLKGFAGQLASSTGTALTTRRIQTMNQIKNFNNALIMDSEDEYTTKQLSFGGLAEIMKENRMGLASAFRMPMSKLFGIPSTGYSSGEDDIENYVGLVESEVRQPMRHVIKKVLKLGILHLFGEDFGVDFSYKPLRTLGAEAEETVKTSKANRYNNLFNLQLMDSKELGEAYKKDDLVSVPLKAEKGLLDDHPATVAQETGAPGQEKPEAAEKVKPEPKAVPKSTGKVERPKKPSLNRREVPQT